LSYYPCTIPKLEGHTFSTVRDYFFIDLQLLLSKQGVFMPWW